MLVGKNESNTSLRNKKHQLEISPPIKPLLQQQDSKFQWLSNIVNAFKKYQSDKLIPSQSNLNNQSNISTTPIKYKNTIYYKETKSSLIKKRNYQSIIQKQNHSNLQHPNYHKPHPIVHKVAKIKNKTRNNQIIKNNKTLIHHHQIQPTFIQQQKINHQKQISFNQDQSTYAQISTDLNLSKNNHLTKQNDKQKKIMNFLNNRFITNQNQNKQLSVPNKKYLQIKSKNSQSIGKIKKNVYSLNKISTSKQLKQPISKKIEQPKQQEFNIKIIPESNLLQKNYSIVNRSKLYKKKQLQTYEQVIKNAINLNQELNIFSKKINQKNIQKQILKNNQNQIKSQNDFCEQEKERIQILISIFNKLDTRKIGQLSRFNLQVDKCPNHYRKHLNPLFNYIMSTNKKLKITKFIQQAWQLLNDVTIKKQTKPQYQIVKKMNFQDLNIKNSHILQSNGQSLDSVVVHKYNINELKGDKYQAQRKLQRPNKQQFEVDFQHQIIQNEIIGSSTTASIGKQNKQSLIKAKYKYKQRDSQITFKQNQYISRPFQKQNNRYNYLDQENSLKLIGIKQIIKQDKDNKKYKQKDQLNKLDILNDRLSKYLTHLSIDKNPYYQKCNQEYKTTYSHML